MPPIQPMSFTVSAVGRLRELVVQVGISAPLVDRPIARSDKRIIDAMALWDTGATNSCITASTAAALGIAPISKAIVQHVQGQARANVYLVNIYLPNGVAIRSVRVTECADNSQFGVIVGMDIITSGDFAITNVGGRTVFSFRFPSSETIDFVQQHQPTGIGPLASPAKVAAAPKKVGRNDPCPCGSGKKYKLCHGK